jgi:hypothetical protein
MSSLLEKSLVVSISQKSEELRLYNPVYDFDIPKPQILSVVFKCLFWLNGSMFATE